MPSILLIDDNRELAENLEEILEEEGIPVDVAHDGASALAMLEEGQYCLAITDVRMPGMSGIQVLEAIRERWPRIPVIVMSAYTSDSQVQAAAEAGALDVLTKPINITYVVDLVERVTVANAAILILEDDPALRGNLCEAILGLTGTLPHAAANVAAAEHLAGAIDFRVAIIDARLPDGNGVAFGQALRARKGESISIFYITGYATELRHELGALLAESKSIKLLEKPFSPRVLLTLVQDAVES